MPNEELTTKATQYNVPEIPQIERDMLVKYFKDKNILKANLEDHELAHAIELCLALNLDPIKKEIYFVAYGKGEYRTFSPIASYQVYIGRGNRTGLLNGWKVEPNFKDGSDIPFSSTCTVYRKDWDHPFECTVYYKELVKRDKSGKITKFWTDMPITMLNKCAVVAAFRMCFAGTPEIQGLPYISEEMPPPGEVIIDSKTSVITQSKADPRTLLKSQLRDLMVAAKLSEPQVLAWWKSNDSNFSLTTLHDLNENNLRMTISWIQEYIKNPPKQQSSQLNNGPRLSNEPVLEYLVRSFGEGKVRRYLTGQGMLLDGQELSNIDASNLDLIENNLEAFKRDLV